MARKRPLEAAGRVVVLEHHSRVLEGNPLGDPHVRKLAVWLPAQYDEGATAGRGKRFPVLYDLVASRSSGAVRAQAHRARSCRCWFSPARGCQLRRRARVADELCDSHSLVAVR